MQSNKIQTQPDVTGCRFNSSSNNQGEQKKYCTSYACDVLSNISRDALSHFTRSYCAVYFSSTVHVCVCVCVLHFVSVCVSDLPPRFVAAGLCVPKLRCWQRATSVSGLLFLLAAFQLDFLKQGQKLSPLPGSVSNHCRPLY